MSVFALFSRQLWPQPAARVPVGLPPLPPPSTRDILARCIAVWTAPHAGDMK